MKRGGEALAASLGLQKCFRLFPDAVERAMRDADHLHELAPRPEGASDEPAHAFRVETGAA